ncbi:hypothetical protein NKW85_09880 [Staphylococcus simulans]|uniref:hypothetical protein n=1 Tax=Staphylococcus simulans TaxID=1286 RepID=UPI001304965F|nr:hypothetical protein [Staphylococcus simulans]MCP6652264.1 hypothetical protein [Klebsiella pneumoniae]UXR34851.1 hypothetical protein MUA31_10740 [Staphylococcus simulans]
MNQNNQLQADPNKVINNLLNKITELEKDNAILFALYQEELENNQNTGENDRGVSE